MADKGVISKASTAAAIAALVLLHFLVLADDAAAAAYWRRLEESMEMELLPAELDRVQRRVLQAKTYIAPSSQNPDHQICVQNCLPGRQYTLPPPGSHCDRRYYNPGC